MTGKLNITVREADDLDTPEFSKNYYFIIGWFLNSLLWCCLFFCL